MITKNEIDSAWARKVLRDAGADPDDSADEIIDTIADATFEALDIQDDDDKLADWAFARANYLGCESIEVDPEFTNHDPGHYLDSVCTVLIAWEDGSNWAFYASNGEDETFVNAVQARAVKAGCKSSSFGGRDYFRGHITRRTVHLTEAGEQWLARK